MNYERIDFVKLRRPFFQISIVLTVIGVIVLAIFKMNYGVDFKAGTTIDVSSGVAMERATVEGLVRTAVPHVKEALMTFGNNNERVTIRLDEVLAEAETRAIISAFKDQYGNQVTYEENTVDVAMAKELAMKAIMALSVASIFIALYVLIRFEWRFAIAAIISTLHDAVVVVSVFAIFRFEVNLPFVAAVLTIIGYSINDTIVIFDRIRENMKFAKLKSFEDVAKLVNHSVAQTMTRSINTVITVFVAALALFIFGSESIRLFSLAMLVGLVAGVYSSIFIAAPLWALLKSKTLNSRKLSASAGKE